MKTEKKGPVWEVWCLDTPQGVTFPFCIKSRDPARTVSKLVRKGYREEDIIIVLSGPSYLVGGYDPHDKVWAFRYESLHPITARAGTPAYGPCLASGPDLGEVINQLIRH